MSDSVTEIKANECQTTASSKDDSSQEFGKIKRSLPRDETTVSRLTEVVEQFDLMNLREPLLRGIYGYGCEHPSDIQQRALRPCIEGYDVIVQSQSGTGKTINAIIAILQQLNTECKDCQALILAPIRELAQGIQKVVVVLGEYMKVTCHACIGGVHIREDIKQLEAGAQVVVGTPGRIHDILKRSILRSENIKTVVLDEADEILSRGFKDQICDILPMLPENIQIMILSATMPYDVSEFTTKYMVDPVKIIVKKEEKTLEGIRQFYVLIEREEWKLETLYDLFDSLPITQAVIYCNAPQKIDWLTEKLHSHNLTASALHRNLDEKQCEEAMKEFRTGSSRILVRQDMLETPTDVAQVSLILNYELPTNRENYLHRIGRGGAFGRKGLAINFITTDEQEKLRQLEQFYNTKIEELPMDIADFI